MTRTNIALATLTILLCSCASLQLTAVKATDGAAQVGTIVGMTVIPTIDKMKRDAILQTAKDEGGTEVAKAKAHVAEATWEKQLNDIRKIAYDYNAAVSSASATLALIIMGVEKKLTYSDVIAQLSSAGQALVKALQANGIDLTKYIGGN